MTTTENLQIEKILLHFGLDAGLHSVCTGTVWTTSIGTTQRHLRSPINGAHVGIVSYASTQDWDDVVETASKAFEYWRLVPAPKRGEIIRQFGDSLRKHKQALGELVTLEMGKILQEGLGEVQEMIDICDFAVGLSRQLYGLTIASERPSHRMFETWQPLGIVGVISAFNFPVAVWAWNAALAAVCGDVVIWKPSEKTPLTALACHKIWEQVARDNNLPEGIFNLVIGDAEIGKKMSSDARIPLVSATGSTRMGKAVASVVAGRLGKTLLELGGNNAIIITEHANLDLAMRSTIFGAVGTCGQRCTSTRRLIVHESKFEEVKSRLLSAYKKLPVGNPLSANTLVGPLVDAQAADAFEHAIHAVLLEGGKLLFGGKRIEVEGCEEGQYVIPAIVEAQNQYKMVQEETFAPILYLIKYEGGVENAIAIQNGVKQGLSSAIFTDHIRQGEMFLSPSGSDCGIANVNIGTSGAEIGGAFGGEKETGGGRESGSDAWKVYMRRQTSTINFGTELPLAQGIKFDI